MKCNNCNWSWDIEEDDTDPSLCHKCGYNSELGKFDMGSLKKWKEDNNSPFKEYAEEGYHIKKKLNEDNHLFHHTKKNDENFYRKALNYLVKNKGGNVMKSLSQYLYCRELHCLPLTQTNGFKKVINFLKEEFQINKDEQQLLFLLLIFNLDVKNFLTDPLDYGKGYKLYHVSHTAQSIEQDDDWEEDDCQMCDGEGVINYQDYDTPQQCEDCIGSGMVHNQTISYRLDYYMSSFLSKNSLIIPDGEFSEDEFISINKDNDIIHYKEKLDEVIYSHSRHFDEEVGMVLSIESANYFDIHDLDLTTL